MFETTPTPLAHPDPAGRVAAAPRTFRSGEPHAA